MPNTLAIIGLTLVAAEDNFVVTSSKIVWHEHLLFTKAYRDFCIDVPGFSFDHNPELIPITGQTA